MKKNYSTLTFLTGDLFIACVVFAHYYDRLSTAADAFAAREQFDAGGEDGGANTVVLDASATPATVPATSNAAGSGTQTPAASGGTPKGTGTAGGSTPTPTPSPS